MTMDYAPSENGTGDQQQQHSGPMPPEGFFGANMAGVLKLLLETGETFEDVLLRAGLPRDDAEDIAEMFRRGVTFQVPELVLHSQHSLIAAAAEGDKAKLYALMGLGNRPVQPSTPQRKPIRSRLFGKGKVDARSLS